MQRNNHPITFFDVPSDITEAVISTNLSLQELVALSETNTQIKNQFQHALRKEKLNHFLKLVAQGKEEQVEKALKSNPELLLYKGTITDDAGRTFRHITAFQYAIWALDRHMWTLLLKYLPFDAAKNQLFEHEFSYADYKVEYGRHYDFSPLLNALRLYVLHAQNWDYDTSVNFWCKQVGGAQCTVPMHVVQESCRENMRFDSITFKNDTLPRHTQTFAKCSWFPLSETNMLGKKFAFLLCDQFGVAQLAKTLWAGFSMLPQDQSHAWLNWKFINDLAFTRQQEYLELRNQLLMPTNFPSYKSG